jgi:hypothetical protein
MAAGALAAFNQESGLSKNASLERAPDFRQYF